jgi:hypothetical protein
MNRLVTVVLTVDAERYGVDPKDDEAVINLVRDKLEFQPFPWEHVSYSLDEDIGYDD